jgi:cation diffusion facilitator CzcD-associated flavoprotein CzcO
MNMSQPGTATPDQEVEPSRIVSSWLSSLEAALCAQDRVEAVSDLFVDDCWWRDVVSLTWDIRTFRGQDQVRKFVDGLESSVNGLRLSDEYEPRHLHEPYEMVEAVFDFDLPVGVGRGLVRLRRDTDRWLAWTFFTSLHELTGVKRPIGAHRLQQGHQDLEAKDQSGWLEQREQERSFENGDPNVVIVGGGQAGLAIAAELRMLGVRALIIEKNSRIGDNWRQRYSSLVLHDPVWADHLPHLPFPDSWPVYTPKDKLAGWFELYVEALELNVWTNSEICNAHYDPARGLWALEVSRDGERRTMMAEHVVMATGLISGPRIPDLPGRDEFAGEVQHSSTYLGNQDRAGQRAIVVGASSSGHDIATDLYQSGAEVTMVQRSSTYVMSQKNGVAALFGGTYYEGGPELPLADLISASYPYALHLEGAPAVTAAIAEQDAELLAGLRAAGFLVDMGIDNRGLLSKALTRGGGYYIDVGASGLIVDGKIAVKSGAGIQRLTGNGVELEDGTHLDADLVVLATGFNILADTVHQIFGSEVADSCGEVWGLDDEGEIQGMWRPSGHPGLWITGGSLIMVRVNSKYLALQIKSALLGVNGHPSLQKLPG